MNKIVVKLNHTMLLLKSNKNNKNVHFYFLGMILASRSSGFLNKCKASKAKFS